MCEASILKNLCHYSVCFLHGVQCEEEPYYVVTNAYLIDGYSVTIYDFLCLPTSATEDICPKQKLVEKLRLELSVINWCHIMYDIAQGLNYIHSRKIVHRDLKANNVVVHEQGRDLKPVLIDFGKSLKAPIHL